MGRCFSSKSSSKQFKMHFFLHQRSAFELLSRLNHIKMSYLAYVCREIFLGIEESINYNGLKLENKETIKWDGSIGNDGILPRCSRRRQRFLIVEDARVECNYNQSLTENFVDCVHFLLLLVFVNRKRKIHRIFMCPARLPISIRSQCPFCVCLTDFWCAYSVA